MHRLLSATLALTLLACTQGAPEVPQASTPAAEPPTSPSASAPQSSPPATEPAGVGLLSSRGAPANADSPSADTMGETGDGSGAVTGAGLRFTLPAGWQRQQPTSRMRMAQAAIPGSAGEGLLTVFFFGPGGGGGVDANLDRWIGQIDGGEPARESFEANGLRVTWVEKTGTLQPSGFGMGPSEPQPGSRLYGAVLEGPGGPWFFKATGPGETLAGHRDGFVAMLRDARLQ